MSVKEVTQQNFEDEVLKSDKTVLVDFYADWCGPCKMMAPIMEQVSSEYGDSADFVKVNIDENKALASKYQVMTIPNFVVFKNGRNEESLVGVQSKDSLINLLK